MVSLIMNSMKIDTTVLTQFNGIITAVVVIGMILIIGKNLLKGSIGTAIVSIILAGLVLWAVNDLNAFVEFIKVFINFSGGVFGG